MKRSLWTARMTDDYVPSWPCPVCSKGTLIMVPKSLISKETIISKRERIEDYWTPDFVDYVFAAWLKCSQPNCEQEVVVSGVGGVEQWETYDPEAGPETVYSDYFAPKYLSPMPDVFEIPKKCPNDTKEHLRAGFKLFLSDQSAAANRIRVAVETLLDHLSIPRKRKEANNKFSDLSLHKRIEIFMKDEPSLGVQLMALKWLGNTASHEAGVTRDDLLDAFEILEHILAEVIEKRSDRVTELARKLTKKHGRR